MNGNLIKALLDANVLYSAVLRDVLMMLAIFGVYEPRWTNQIHDEWTRNLALNRSDVERRKLEKTRRLMDFHLPDALVSGYEHRIEKLILPDANDRHVLAAAIQSRASVIVTFNLILANLRLQGLPKFVALLEPFQSQL